MGTENNWSLQGSSDASMNVGYNIITIETEPIEIEAVPYWWISSPTATVSLTPLHWDSEYVKFDYVIKYNKSKDGVFKSPGNDWDGAIDRYFNLAVIDTDGETTITSTGFDLAGLDDTTVICEGTIDIEKRSSKRDVTVSLYVNWEDLRFVNAQDLDGDGNPDITDDYRLNFGSIKAQQKISIAAKTSSGAGGSDGDGTETNTPTDTSTDTTTTSTDEVPLWVADWSTAKILELDANTTTKPPTITSVTIEESADGDDPTLVVKVDTSDITDTKYKLGVVFDVVRDDVTRIYGVDDLIIYTDSTKTETLTARFKVANGYRYNVRCKAIKTVGTDRLESEWSDWYGDVAAAPLAPRKITVCRATSSDSVNIDSIYLEWTESTVAKKYEIQYATTRDLDNVEDSDNFQSIETGDKGTKYTFKVSGTGSEYYVRVRALGENDTKSAWTDAKRVVLGSNPEAPTTWSSASTVTIGESVNLYWVHNSTDGSDETCARLYVWKVYSNGAEGVYVNAIDIYKPNPKTFIPGDPAYLNEYYIYRNVLYKCIKETESAKNIADTTIFEKIKDNYDPNETSYYTLKIPLNDTDDLTGVEAIDWTVCTWGIDSNKQGVYAERKRIDVYAKPSVEITVTDYQGKKFDTLKSLPIKVKAKATDPTKTQKPIGYYLSVEANESYTTRDAIGNPKVVHKGDLVYYEYFDINTSLSTTLSAGDITLENNISYTITCIASMDSGLTAENSYSFTVGWSVEQHLPTASILVNTNTYAAAIRPYCEVTTPVWYTVNKRSNGTYSVGSRVSGEITDLVPLVKSANAIGKNLLDMATIIEANNCEAISLNGVLTITKNASGVTYARLMPIYLTAGKSYRLSYSSSGSCKPYWCMSDGTPVSGNPNATTYTPTESGYHCIEFRHTGANNSIVTIRNAQVEVGTKATAYEVYQGVDIVMEKTTTGVEIWTSGGNYYCCLYEKTLVEDVVLSVYRRDHDGGFTEIAKNIPNKNTYIPDPHPALDYARYRIVATSTKTGYVSYYDLPNQPIKCNSVIIQWDEEWNNYDADKGRTTEKTWTGSLLSIPYNIDVSDKRATDVEMIKYVGRKHPVSYYGTHLGETASWSCAVPKSDKETLYALRRLAAWAGDVYVREPSGVGYWANVVVSFSQKHCDPVVPVSFEITRVEGGV